jgi:PilZ domain
MANQRKSERIAITAMAEVTLPDGRNLSTYVANVSREGVGIYFKEPLPAGTDLNIKITFRDESGATRSETLDGEVKWAYNGFYAVGVMLKGLDLKLHKDLIKYIDEVEQRNKIDKT